MITSISHDDFNDTMEIVFCYGGFYQYAKKLPKYRNYEKIRFSWGIF